MSENEEQVVKVKADDEVAAPAGGEAAQKPVKKRRRGLWIALGVLALLAVFGVGALAGGAVGYKLSQSRGRMLVRPSLRLWTSPRERFNRELPARPGRDVVGLESGALIVEVKPDSPADEAGIREGDVLLAFDGKTLDAESDLGELIAAHAPGDVVTLEVAELGVQSEGDGREVTVTLAEHPENEGKAYLGVSFVPMAGHLYGIHDRAYTFRFGDDDDSGERGTERFQFFWQNR